MTPVVVGTRVDVDAFAEEYIDGVADEDAVSARLVVDMLGNPPRRFAMPLLGEGRFGFFFSESFVMVEMPMFFGLEKSFMFILERSFVFVSCVWGFELAGCRDRVEAAGPGVGS